MEVGTTKHALKMQNEIDAVFSIKDVKCERRQHKVTNHVINKHFTWKLMLSHFCCSNSLSLPQTKFLELTQLIIIDVLHHHIIMMDSLCSQKKIASQSFQCFVSWECVLTCWPHSLLHKAKQSASYCMPLQSSSSVSSAQSFKSGVALLELTQIFCKDFGIDIDMAVF